jgi:hypothetical protein
MQRIYVSNDGDDRNDGLSDKTPVRSWRRVLMLCKGANEIHLMEDEATRIRLLKEIEEKASLRQTF